MNCKKGKYDDDLFDELDNDDVTKATVAHNVTSNECHQASYEENKIKEGQERLGEIHEFCKSIDAEIAKVCSASSFFVEKTKQAHDAYEKYCSYMQYLRGEELSAKYRLERTVFSLSEESCQKVKSLIEESVTETTNKMLSSANKRLEEIGKQVADKITEDMNARMEIVQKEMEQKEEKIKIIENKAKGIFLTSGQAYFCLIILLACIMFGAWGMAKIIPQGSLPTWTVVLLLFALTSNFLWYLARWICKVIWNKG